MILKYVKIIIFFFVLPVFINNKCFSQIIAVEDIGKSNFPKIKTINIFYNAAVTNARVADLSSLLDKVNRIYTNATKINLFINSYGGDTTAGFVAYQHIKSSRIPITTIAEGVVASMASIMFCASKDRLALQEHSFFLLHAFFQYPNSAEGNIIHFEQDKETLVKLSEIAKQIYRTCTNLSNKRLDSIMLSEDNHLLIRGKDAIKIGIISKIIDKIPQAQVSYYILDSDDNKE